MKTHNIHPADIMIYSIAKLLKDRETVFFGVSSQMPMISVLLAKRLHAPNLTYLNIPGGISPRLNQVSDYSSAGSECFNGSKGVFRLEDVFDLSMRGKLDVAFLSGVQFDKEGNVNASAIGDYKKPKVQLPGGAGSAVLIPTVKKAIIWRTKHDIRTFVEKVDFKTTRGNIYKIVTPLCVFKYENGSLDVESISPLTTIDEVAKNTGFTITTDNYKLLELPPLKIMNLIKEIDKKGVRYNEFI